MGDSFLAELQRRRVFRVALGYCAAAGGTLQVADIVATRLNLPAWLMPALIVLSLVGLAVAVALAWVFDITPQGVVRTDPPKPRASLRWVLGAVLLIAGAAGAWAALRPRVKPAGDRVAVFPFTFRGSEQFAYLGEGMVDLLSTNLSGAGLHAVDPHALLASLRASGTPAAPDDAAPVAGKFGARLYVMGSVVEVNQRLRVLASLYDGEKPVAEVRAEGDAAHVFEMVDQLTADLRGRVAQPDEKEAGQFVRLAAMTTSSVDALRAYLEGEREMRRARPDVALGSYRRAADLDPSFALAWYRLAISAAWTRDMGQAREAATRAAQLASRLSAQDQERITAAAAFLTGKSHEAERTYRHILAQHPEDVDAWYMLGETLVHYGHFFGRPLADAREPFEKTLVLDPQHDGALSHLIGIVRDLGLRSEAVPLIDRYLKLVDPASPFAGGMPFYRSWAAHDDAEHARQLAALKTAPDVEVQKAWFWSLWEDDGLAEAERISRIALDDPKPEIRAIGNFRLGIIEAAQGRVREAAALMRQGAFPHSPTAPLNEAALATMTPWFPFRDDELRAIRAHAEAFDAQSSFQRGSRAWVAGTLAVRLRDFAGAEESARALDALTDLGTIGPDYAAIVRADVAFAQGKRDEAAAQLAKVRFEVSYNFADLWTPSLLHAQLAPPEEALRWLDAASESMMEPVAFAPRALAKARTLEKLGRRDDAAAQYARVIELWKDCDPELRPSVDEANQALQRLRVTVTSTAR